MKKNYHSVSTLSCFVSFSLLVMMKLYNSITVGYHSVKSDKMMSAYMSEFVSFNILDKDYVESKSLNKCKGHPNLKEKEDEIRLQEIKPVIVEE